MATVKIATPGEGKKKGWWDQQSPVVKAALMVGVPAVVLLVLIGKRGGGGTGVVGSEDQVSLAIQELADEVAQLRDLDERAWDIPGPTTSPPPSIAPPPEPLDPAAEQSAPVAPGRTYTKAPPHGDPVGVFAGRTLTTERTITPATAKPPTKKPPRPPTTKQPKPPPSTHRNDHGHGKPHLHSGHSTPVTHPDSRDKR